MARPLTGSPFPVKGGHGIRWKEDGRTVRHTPKPPFPTKTAARKWFRDNVVPRLETGTPSADITLDAFAELFLQRHTGEASTIATLRDRLAPARAQFGTWKLTELEHAADDIAAWRATLPEGSRYRLMSALRQCLNAAGPNRWRYITRNPAVDAGTNPQPRAKEIDPLHPDELTAILAELDTPDLQLVTFAAETGLRPEEWCALERADHDRHHRRILVQRKYAKGKLTPYPKTHRRSVPLTDAAHQALLDLPPRIDTPLIFPAAKGQHITLDNWRSRVWYPALAFAAVRQRGPYALRHTFATEALAAGISTFELARVMGTSLEMIDQHYGHLAHDSEDQIRARLNARQARKGHERVTATDQDRGPSA